MSLTRKRITAEEEKRMWLWLLKNLQEDKKEAYLSCGLQLWIQYIERYGIQDRTADSYATRFRKVMKPALITCPLKASQIKYIVRKCGWTLYPTQQLLLNKMLADEIAFENGDISGYVNEEANASIVTKEEDISTDFCDESTPTLPKVKVEKTQPVESKENDQPSSSRPSRRCNDRITNYNEKYLSRRSNETPPLQGPLPSAKALNDILLAEEPKDVPLKRPAAPCENPLVSKKRILADVNDTPKSIFVTTISEPTNKEPVENGENMVKESPQPSDAIQVTPTKVTHAASSSSTEVLLTPKSILASGQRKVKEDGSAMRVHFQSPEKLKDGNLTPKRNINTPNSFEFNSTDAEILQLLWHKAHGQEIEDLTSDELLLFQNISLFKDLHVRIGNVLSFFRGRKNMVKTPSDPI